MFPEKKGVDYSKLILTPEGEYSITKRKDGQKILKHILDITGNNSSLLYLYFFAKRTHTHKN